MIRAPITPERARKTYDSFSVFYDYVVKLESGPRTRGLEVANVKEGNAVLEVGFGTGNTLTRLAEMVGERGEVHGIDSSSKMVEKTRKRLEKRDLLDRVNLAFGDARKLPYCSDKFNVVLNSYMLDLIDTPEIPLVLSEFKRVLKPQGRLSLVNLSKGESWCTNMGLYEWVYKLCPSCLGGCRPVLTKPFLEELGFQNVKRELMLAGHLMPSEIVYGKKP
jgi:ubiquinone/menaquinone biosynthesis C-methylase UbiE